MDAAERPPIAGLVVSAVLAAHVVAAAADSVVVAVVEAAAFELSWPVVVQQLMSRLKKPEIKD